MSWPSISIIEPVLRILNKKNNQGFVRVLQNLIKTRIELPKDAQHDFYSLAANDESPTGDSLKQTELWSEASVFVPAGESIARHTCQCLAPINNNNFLRIYYNIDGTEWDIFLPITLPSCLRCARHRNPHNLYIWRCNSKWASTFRMQISTCCHR